MGRQRYQCLCFNEDIRSTTTYGNGDVVHDIPDCGGVVYNKATPQDNDYDKDPNYEYKSKAK